ncbi:hypothetical protein L1887_24133 [Cichorium endivia]|nr:hypothetical protein L1887_24133 [Cichorium endivia]
MFTSPASSHSSSGTFGCPPVFGRWNQKGDTFAPNTLSSGIVFGSPAATGTSTWAFGQTSSPLSSIASFGSPSNAGFGSSTSALGFSSSGNFGSPSGFVQLNERGDSFPSKSLDRGNVFGPPNSHGSSTWTFNQTSSSLSTPTSFGPLATKSTFDLKQSHFSGQERGSSIANYKKTPETEYSPEKLVSISAMPVYNDKSHEELRLEDYKLSEKGGFGIRASAVKSTSSIAPLTPNPFGKTIDSVATKTPSWSWKFPGPTSTPQPLHFSSSTNNSLTTPPLNSFNPFLPTTNLTSQTPTSFKSPTFTSTSPSWSLAPLNQNTFTNPSFTSLPTQVSSSSFSTPTFITPSSFNQPTTLFKSWSLAPLNQNTFTNSSFTSLPTQMSSSSFSSPTFAPFITPSSFSGSTFNQPTTLFTPSTQNNEETTGTIGQTIGSQLSSSEITHTKQPSTTVTSPFGTLPPISHLSIEASLKTQSIQYGISSMPVKDKPAPVRYSLLTTRHLSRKIKLPVRKYDPKLNGPKVRIRIWR